MISTQRSSQTGLRHPLLRFGQRLVPAAERSEWLRFWQAELWYMQARTSRPGHHRSLTLGLLRDALWLRVESWHIALSGTALLCLTLLCTLVGIAALPAFTFAGGWRAF
ncbi:MAG: hypothetical protein INR71_12845, partial [Terriglobus roseus]|nr:hypothetical protein [Terriglobus roseus]